MTMVNQDSAQQRDSICASCQQVKEVLNGIALIVAAKHNIARCKAKPVGGPPAYPPRRLLIYC